MANGIFTLKQQLQGSIQKAWYGNTQPILSSFSSYAGSFTSTSSQYLSTSASFTLSGNFTIEAWVYWPATTQNSTVITIGDSASTGFEIYINNNYNQVQLYSNNAYTFGSTTIGAGIIPKTWSHIAIVRSGTTITAYVNGVNGASVTGISSTFSGVARIGAEYYSSTLGNYFNGQISNLRINNTTAVYTSNFVPSTSPLTAISGTQLLTLQNATIVDNSSNSYTITNNNSVTTASTSIAVPITFAPNGNSTPAVEYLVVAGGGGGGRRAGGGGGAGGLIQGFTPVTSGTPLTITVGTGGAGATGDSSAGSTGNPSVFYNVSTKGGGGGASYGASSSTGGSGGGGSSCFVPYFCGSQGTFGQGYAGGKGTNFCGGTDFDAGGGGGAGTVGLNGTKSRAGNGGSGIASVISGTLTGYAGGGGGGDFGGSAGSGGFGGGGSGGLPTPCSGSVNSGGGGGGSGYTCAGVNGGSGGSGIVIISYPDTYNAPSALTGTYTASTSGSGSVYSSGSAYLLIADNSVLSVGAGNFTIEIWLNPTSLPTSGNYKVIWSKRTSGSTSGGATLAIDSSGNYLFFVASGTGTWGISGTSSGQTASLGSWQHLAMVRNGNNLILYKNGVAGTTVTLNFTVVDADQMSIMAGSAAGGQVTDGYFSNFRLVKGTAVYTSNFTPSTTPLTAITNTSLLLNTVSGAPFTDSSGNNLTVSTVSSPTWNQLSPFATGLGYKNRVYKFTGSGTVTF